MSNNNLKITFKIYLEAEDVARSRIVSSTSFVHNLLNNCSNSYFHNTQIDDENDLEDLSLRYYIERDIEEDECSNPTDAKTFLSDMVEILEKIALAHSFLDMEGSFSISYGEIQENYTFISEGGQGLCDFTKTNA